MEAVLLAQVSKTVLGQPHVYYVFNPYTCKTKTLRQMRGSSAPSGYHGGISVPSTKENSCLFLTSICFIRKQSKTTPSLPKSKKQRTIDTPKTQNTHTHTPVLKEEDPTPSRRRRPTPLGRFGVSSWVAPPQNNRKRFPSTARNEEIRLVASRFEADHE